MDFDVGVSDGGQRTVQHPHKTLQSDTSLDTDLSFPTWLQSLRILDKDHFPGGCLPIWQMFPKWGINLLIISDA